MGELPSDVLIEATPLIQVANTHNRTPVVLTLDSEQRRNQLLNEPGNFMRTRPSLETKETGITLPSLENGHVYNTRLIQTKRYKVVGKSVKAQVATDPKKPPRWTKLKTNMKNKPSRRTRGRKKRSKVLVPRRRAPQKTLTKRNRKTLALPMRYPRQWRDWTRTPR